MIDTEPLIAIESISKTFGNRNAVDHVSLEIPLGQITALLGPNGGGKTTLFRMISSLLRPDTGYIRVDGLDPQRDGAEYRRQLGVIFQSPSLDKKLTAAENLMHFGHLHGLRGQTLSQRIAEMLDRLEVADRAGDLVETLSGGLARRVEIAKCMLTRPKLLLMDEPSTGLDPSARRTLWGAVDRLRRDEGVTVLLTTHFLDEADRCERVAILDHGKLVAFDAPSALRAQLGEEVITIQSDQPDDVARILESEFKLDVQRVDHTLRIEADQPATRIAKLAERLAGLTQSITLSQPTLEDVFIHLTGRRFDP